MSEQVLSVPFESRWSSLEQEVWLWPMVTDQVRAVSGLFLILFVPGGRVCDWPAFALDGATGHAHRASGSVIGTPREDFEKARSWNRRLCAPNRSEP